MTENSDKVIHSIRKSIGDENADDDSSGEIRHLENYKKCKMETSQLMNYGIVSMRGDNNDEANCLKKERKKKTFCYDDGDGDKSNCYCEEN